MASQNESGRRALIRFQPVAEPIPMVETMETVEQEINRKDLNAPRVRPQDLEAEVSKEEYQVFADSTLTVCVLTLKNGFTVVGESACASPENFDKELGERIARQKALDKLWPLLGFRLRDQLATN